MANQNNYKEEIQEINEILSKYRKIKNEKSELAPIALTLDEVQASLDDCRRMLGINKK